MSQAGNFITSGGGGGGGANSFPTDFGTATPLAGVLNIIAGTASLNSGSSVSFSGTGNTVELNVSDASFNTIIGSFSGNSTILGSLNTVLGSGSMTSVTTASLNVAIGVTTLPNLTTGNWNIVIGTGSGGSYNGSETSNILIASNNTGTNGESNTLRLGSGTGVGVGQMTRAFISGIDGVDVGSVATIVTENANQLGTAVLTAGTGITITPGPNTITIDATGGSGITSVPTDSGTATPAAGILNIITNNAALNAGSTVLFSGSGNTVTLNVTDVDLNTIVGKNSGNLTISGDDNTIFGAVSGSSLTSGSENASLGEGNLPFLTTGDFNVILGNTSAGNYTGDESSNILIGYNVNGTNGESNVLRIGTGNGVGAGELTKAFICGIDGINVGSTATVVTEASNQLGTAVITAGTGISVTPGANTITIATTGVVVLTYTNVNTTPYTVLTTDDFLSVDCSGGVIIVRLPNAATLGKTFVIKDRTGSAAANNITVTTVGGAVNIDGATTFVMNTNFQAISLIGNGSSYEIY